jgi:putative addiction module component (TIGR02574 family)
MDELVRGIESKTLKLPPKERARLTQRLIARLDPTSDRDADQTRLEETERRLDELESGKVAGFPRSRFWRRRVRRFGEKRPVSSRSGS